MARSRNRGGRERREPIDIDRVLADKYPNRAAEPEGGQPAPDTAAAPDPVAVAHPDAGARDAGAADVPGEIAVVVGAAAGPPAIPPPAPVPPAVGPAATAPAGRLEWPEPRPTPYYEPPNLDHVPWVPIPGEPSDEHLLVGPPRRPATVVETADGPSAVASPFGALQQRRDRIARQAEEAFAEVHRLRTESLRRASQAEHNAELASSARVRAARMTRESRRYEANGRHRSVAVPDAEDAFHDVHRFRVEALRRAHEAEHTADTVKRARERAARLLLEQRRMEAEMDRLRRGGPPAENL